MRGKLQKIGKMGLIVLLLIAQVLPFFMNKNEVNAASLTTSYDLITGVSLTDTDGNPLGTDIELDSELILSYDFAIPNAGDVAAGDTFVITIPPEILISAGTSFGISTDFGDIVANGVLSTNGEIELTFTEFAATNSGIVGSFWFTLGFDEEEVEQGGSTNISFDIGGTASPVVITVDFEDPTLEDIGVTKTGVYDETTNEITWTMVVNPNDEMMLNGSISDQISTDQTFIPGSLKVNDVVIDGADYDYSGNLLTYDFPSYITDEQIVEFKTLLDLTVLTPDLSEYTVSNSSELTSDVGTVNSNIAEVDIPIDILEKTGSYNSATHQIDWTITINESEFDLTNVIITETIPTGLTLDAATVLLDGASTTYSETGQILTFNLGSISEEHSITFSTDVEEERYLSNGTTTYTNNVSLDADEFTTAVTDFKGVGVKSNAIKKTGQSYDAATGQITWKIVVNSNEVTLTDAVVTDDIPIGQEFVSGSESIDNGALSLGFNYVAASAGDTTSTGRLTYTFDSTITGAYTIEYKTQITDEDVYKSNVQTTLYNTATLTNDSTYSSTSTGSQVVDSQIIDKTGIDYDYTTRLITWEVVVNDNNIDLNNVEIEDIIPDGQEYVDNSFQITSGTVSAGTFNYTAATESDNAFFTYDITGLQSTEFTFTYQTEITDLSLFYTNGTKTVSNTITIDHDNLTAPISDIGTQDIENIVVGKTADYTSGNRYIDWTVIINSNDVGLSTGELTDTIQDGLLLDTSSIILAHQSIDASGNLITGSEIALTSDNVKYDFDTKEFLFVIPSPVENGYILTYRTYIQDQSLSPFSNSISFSGTGQEQTSTANNIVVSWIETGSKVSTDTGTISITKVNSEDSSTVLEGAVFRLYDQYGNAIDEVTTDASGEAVFGDLRFGVPYSVKEYTAPTGYNLDTVAKDYIVYNTATEKDVTTEWDNDIIKGIITFTKTDEDGNALSGATFTLYDSNSDIVTTAVSTSTGLVEFENVDYGSYTIKETIPPTGYVLSTETLTATITTEGATVQATPSSVSNTMIRGNVEFKKVDVDTNLPISGAQFEIYASTDTSFTVPIAAATSNASGIVQFTDIAYGSYVIKETQAASHYALSSATLSVDIQIDGQTYDLGDFTNRLLESDIQIEKQNVVGDPLENATFGLYSGTTLLEQKVTNGEGILVFEDIPYGNYSVKELIAPEMYDINTTVYDVSVDTEGETIRFTVVDERNSAYPWGSVQALKTKEDGTALAGAEIGLYNSTDTDYTAPLKTAITNVQGYVYFDELAEGTYNIKEIEAPEGYVLSETVLTVTVENTSETVDAGTIVDKTIRGTIIITGTDPNGDPLPGVIYEIYDEDGNKVGEVEADEDGIAIFEDMPYGDYTVRSDDIEGTIEVGIDKDGEVESDQFIGNLTNTDVDTGDSSHGLYLYVILLLIAQLGIGITGYKVIKTS